MTVRGLIRVPVQRSNPVVLGLVAIVISPTPLTPVAAPIVTPLTSSAPSGPVAFGFMLLFTMIDGVLAVVAKTSAADAGDTRIIALSELAARSATRVARGR